MPDFPALLQACNVSAFENDDEEAVIVLSHYITNELLERAGANLDNLNQKEMFYALLICFTAVGQLTADTRLSYEAISIVACSRFYKSYNSSEEGDKLFGSMFRTVINLNNFIAIGEEPSDPGLLSTFENLKDPVKLITDAINSFVISKGHPEFKEKLLTPAGEMLGACIKNI